MGVSDLYVDAALEAGLLQALKGGPGLYWAVADLVDSAMFTGERQAEFRSLVENPQPATAESDEAAKAAAEKHARAVGELYRKRELAARLERALGNMRERPAADILQQLEDTVSELTNAIREDKAGQLAQATGLFPELVEDLRKRRIAVREHGAAAVGLATGFKKLDDLLGGLQAGLHILAAEPGAGKTSLAVQVAARVARDGVPVVYVSFEETLQRLALKALCGRAGLIAKQYADGREDTRPVETAVADFGPEFERLYFLEGNARVTTGTIKARALQVMARWNSGRCLIVIDYLQRWAGMRRESSEYRLLVDLVTSELREMALRLDSPVLAICSQNRAGENEAKMSSLKESGNLEYSADTVSVLRKSEGIGSGSARSLDLVVLKNRFGDVGSMSLIFKPAVGTFAQEDFARR